MSRFQKCDVLGFEQFEIRYQFFSDRNRRAACVVPNKVLRMEWTPYRDLLNVPMDTKIRQRYLPV